MLRASVAFCVAVASFAMPLHARADELSDFEAARGAYVNDADYERAAALFERLVGGPIPRVRNSALRIESRKYLGAAYMLLGRQGEAEQQFRALLEEDLEYELDPVAFGTTTRRLFERVRVDIERERREAEEERIRRNQLRERLELQRDLARRDQNQRLRELASVEIVEHQNSRFLASVPFGIGQFQNGHRRLGAALAISESALAAAAGVSFFIHNRISRNPPEAPSPSTGNPGSPDFDQARRVELGMRVMNWLSWAGLATLVTVGIVDAHLRFEAETRITRERELPLDLQEDLWAPPVESEGDEDPPGDGPAPADEAPGAPSADDEPPGPTAALRVGLLSASLELTF